MSVVKQDPVVPFANGSQFADWQGANCDRCKLADNCEIATELAVAYCTDGAVTPEIATRMGYKNDLSYCWKCSEVDWTEEWKAEVMSRTEHP